MINDKFKDFAVPYDIDQNYKTKSAYFCMEYGIDQSLKIFSGGLGFLAGSHMRSAYELKQNMVGIGILWKYGYYDQIRKSNREMDALWLERQYNMLEDTGILLDVDVHNHNVKVKVLYLAPETFNTCPVFFLTTDIPENDHLSRTITNRLYDNNPETKIAQCIILGIGGVKLLDELNWQPDNYHFNEAHALPAAFELYRKFGSLNAVREKTVFTTHTPVEAGNEKHNFDLLYNMSFFGELDYYEARHITGTDGDTFNHTLVGLRMSRLANGVSKIHGGVAREMWENYSGVCPITHITNAQNYTYWHDADYDAALNKKDNTAYLARKAEMKQELFKVVADQCGKLFSPDVMTLVWARRFGAYKRPHLITQDLERFERIVKNSKYPVQIIWAGKPYPQDYGAIDIWNKLAHLAKNYPNVAILTGYELDLSKKLKGGSDVWLNNPRVPREASGTSGMTGAMLGTVNVSTYDGWVPEFCKQGKNGWMIPKVDLSLPQAEQDIFDRDNMLDVLENEVIPTYYDKSKTWLKIVQTAHKDIAPQFGSNRMAAEYYTKLYDVKVPALNLENA